MMALHPKQNDDDIPLPFMGFPTDRTPLRWDGKHYRTTRAIKAGETFEFQLNGELIAKSGGEQ
jgi:hypothetical protein